jgi:hypothetical protein
MYAAPAGLEFGGFVCVLLLVEGAARYFWDGGQAGAAVPTFATRERESLFLAAVG